MKAVVYERYGPASEVVHLQDVDKPPVGDDEVLIRVRAASVNPYDWHSLTGKPYVMRLQFGLRKPPFPGLGGDLAGDVETVGKGVTQLRPGDAVFGSVNGGVPDHPLLVLGSLAEYVAVSQDWLAKKPERLTYEEAAAIPLAAITALQGLRDCGNVRPGQKVLINGASGGVGTFAVQLAKVFGAEVTGVCSTRNVDMVRSIGADHVVDYTKADFAARRVLYDLMLDNVGNRSLTDCRRVLKPKGMYLASFGQPDHDWFGPFATLITMKVLNRFVGQTMVTLDQHRDKDDLPFLRELLEAGKIVPVIDTTYPLAQTVDAMDYLEEGHARGKVVITV